MSQDFFPPPIPLPFIKHKVLSGALLFLGVSQAKFDRFDFKRLRNTLKVTKTGLGTSNKENTLLSDTLNTANTVCCDRSLGRRFLFLR